MILNLFKLDMKEKKVTRDLFYCFLNCRNKAWLKIRGEHNFRKTDYHVLLDEQRNQIKTEFIKGLLSTENKHLRLFKNISRRILLQNCDYLFDGYLSKYTLILNLYSLSWLRWKQVFGANGGSP